MGPGEDMKLRDRYLRSVGRYRELVTIVAEEGTARVSSSYSSLPYVFQQGKQQGAVLQALLPAKSRHNDLVFIPL